MQGTWTQRCFNAKCQEARAEFPGCRRILPLPPALAALAAAAQQRVLQVEVQQQHQQAQQAPLAVQQQQHMHMGAAAPPLAPIAVAAAAAAASFGNTPQSLYNQAFDMVMQQQATAQQEQHMGVAAAPLGPIAVAAAAAVGVFEDLFGDYGSSSDSDGEDQGRPPENQNQPGEWPPAVQLQRSLPWAAATGSVPKRSRRTDGQLVSSASSRRNSLTSSEQE